MEDFCNIILQAGAEQQASLTPILPIWHHTHSPHPSPPPSSPASRPLQTRNVIGVGETPWRRRLDWRPQRAVLTLDEIEQVYVGCI